MSDLTDQNNGVDRRSVLRSVAFAGFGTAAIGATSTTAAAEETPPVWKNWKLYRVKDRVIYGGSVWEATIASRNAEPSGASVYWKQVSSGNDSSQQPPDAGGNDDPSAGQQDEKDGGSTIRGTYEVGVWVSEEIIDWSARTFDEPRRVQQRAKTYIEAAFDRPHVPYDVSVKLPDVAVPSPGVGVFDEYTTQHPCGWGKRSYKHPLEFFKEWMDADCMDRTPATHSNVVLFGGGGGGLSYVGGTVGTYAGAKYIARVSEKYQPYAGKPYGDRLGLSGMLHEIGHNLITAEPEHHELASLHTRSTGNMKTVMGSSDSKNYCGDTAPADADGRELTYSECALKYFKPADLE